MGSITSFMDSHYRHFNARETVDAATAWCELLDRDGQMLLAVGGAMSTARDRYLARRNDSRRRKSTRSAALPPTSKKTSSTSSRTATTEMVPHYRDLSLRTTSRAPRGWSQPGDRHLHSRDHHAPHRDTGSSMWAEAAESNRPRFPEEFIYVALTPRSSPALRDPAGELLGARGQGEGAPDLRRPAARTRPWATSSPRE